MTDEPSKADRRDARVPAEACRLGAYLSEETSMG
jgi:hypothetical protein